MAHDSSYDDDDAGTCADAVVGYDSAVADGGSARRYALYASA